VAGSYAKPALVTESPCTPPTTMSLSLATANDAAQWSDGASGIGVHELPSSL